MPIPSVFHGRDWKYLFFKDDGWNSNGIICAEGYLRVPDEKINGLGRNTFVLIRCVE
jgi:hypothetical protein